MFSPLKAFKEMHQDKLLDGRDSSYINYNCVAFVYSKIDRPYYLVPVAAKPELRVRVGAEPPTMGDQIDRVELLKVEGPDIDGFCTYILRYKKEGKLLCFKPTSLG